MGNESVSIGHELSSVSSSHLADLLLIPSRRMPEAPESFPVNALVPIPGTPLEGNERVGVTELLRCIATARIVLPT